MDQQSSAAVQAGTVVHSVQTVFSIETYDISKKFDRWLMRLESAFKVFAVPEDKQGAYLLHYMGPDAYDVLCDKISPESPDTRTYKELVDTMKGHYNPEPLEIAENFRFLQRKQHEGESVSEYLTTLQRLATTCKFGTYLKKALRNQFVFGLRNQNIQSRLLEYKDLTIEKALEVAVSMETSARDAAQLHKNNTTVNVHKLYSSKIPHKKLSDNTGTSAVNTCSKNAQPTRKYSSSNIKCFRCGSDQHLANKCNKTKLMCSKCNLRGHLSRVCMKGKRGDNVNQVEDVGEVEDIWSIDTDQKKYREKFTISIEVNQVRILFEIDSGAAVTLINATDFKNLFPKLILQKTDLKLLTYCSQSLDVLGFAEVTVKYNNLTNNLNLYVVNSEKRPLLGREWIRQLGLGFTNISHISQIDIHPRLENLFSKYSIVFSSNMGKIVGLQARLKVKSDTPPFFIKARKVPYALLPKVEKELDLLEKEGILEKVTSAEYATPIVPVIKANGDIRICGDFKSTLNKYLVIDEHPLPTIEVLFSSMAGGDKFTKLDLQQAYLQMEIHPEDRKFLTLSTPKGLYRSTRLMYGIASAPAIWQREIENILKDIQGVSVFLDDIKITAPDDETHFQRLELVLSRLASYNIRVNFQKCKFLVDKIEYCGYIIDKFGIHKTKEKIEAIQNAKVPSNKTEVRAFVGLINYYGRFMKNLSHKLRPIYNLLKDGESFKWDKNCQKAFVEVKEEIMSDRVLAHFDPSLPLILATDASPYAVGAVLSHIYPDGSERPIQFASQTLTKVQQKYAQIDKEAYAIIFGIKKYFYYLFGRPFTLFVDHLPLVQIFSPSKSLPTLTTTRMQHYALFLQSFNYNIKYKTSMCHSNADAMSRLPVKSTNTFQYDVSNKFEIFQIETLPITFKELSDETVKDPNLKSLLQGLQIGKKINAKDRFNIPQIEFSLQNNCIFRQQMAVIPQKLRNKILQELHAAHFGIIKMKALVRGHCWWPGISNDIENVCKNCTDCNKIRNNPEKVPVHPWEPATMPFERVHIDFAGPFMNSYYFILVDAYTRWPEIHMIKDMTSRTAISLLRKIFSTFGLPNCLVSDNAQSFVSYEFKRFLLENGIAHKLSAPYHPATNGLAERYVQTFKQSLRALKGNNNERERQLCKFLFHYRKTPHTVTGISPSNLMFGRDIKSLLDLLKPTSKSNRIFKTETATTKIRELQVGGRVEVRDYTHTDKWEFGRIEERLGKLHYWVRLDDGRMWKRHIDQIRSIGENTLLSIRQEMLTPRDLCRAQDIPEIASDNQERENRSSIQPEKHISSTIIEEPSKSNNLAENNLQIPLIINDEQKTQNYMAENKIGTSVDLPDINLPSPIPFQNSGNISCPDNSSGLRRSKRVVKPPKRCNNEDDYSLAIPYYKMARILPVEVLKRVKKIQEQSGNQSMKGLMHYLKKVLLEVKFGSEADKIFGANSKENLSESILDLLENHCYRDLPNLILKSKIIREYSTDKLISILTEKLPQNLPELSEKYLALAILYIQKCNMTKAQEQLEKISRDSICDLVLENYDLLFETTYCLQNRNKGVTTFSELTALLISISPEVLSSIFVSLMINKKVINLNKFVKVFLEYLPSSIGNDTNSASLLLQKTLEMYFEQYFSKPENIDLSKIIYERGACEAMKLLVRSYLSQLQIFQLREESHRKAENNSSYNGKEEKLVLEDENDDTNKDRHQEKLGYNRMNQTYFEENVKKPQGSYLFSNLRYEYLDKMPPFQIEISSKLYETCLDNHPAKAQCLANEEADLILKKLQALLCSQVVPKQVITEVNGYLAVTESLRGNESLQSIIMGTNDAILLLIDACPQCLLQFGKDRFRRTDEWKFLVATVQRRILRLSQDENLKRVCFFHKKILKDILTYVASSMTLEQLVQVFPQRFSLNNQDWNGDNSSFSIDHHVKTETKCTEDDLDLLKEIQNYEPYVIICKETMHANQINKLIITTGQQLLCSLNL